MNDCFICTKHQNPNNYTGEIIAECGGVVITHFPKLPDQKTTPGHLIIEPRRHITDLGDMNKEEAEAIGQLMKAGAEAVKSELKAEHVYVFRINDQVPHLHFHLVPRYPNTPKEYWGFKIWDWPDRKTISLEQIYDVAKRLKVAVQL